jgi:4-hydroxymandelate oxidase
MEPVNIYDFEELARKKLSKMIFDYYASGACDEITLRENHEAFDKVHLKYRVLKDVSKIDLTSEVLGQYISFPVMIAPAAFQGLAHPDAELAMVRAASSVGTILVLSTLSNTAVEDVVKVSSNPVWFQLYIYKDREATKELIQRVVKAGCKTLVVTVDAPYLGKREGDLRNLFKPPDELELKNMSKALTESHIKTGEGSALSGYFASNLDPSISWKDIGWLRSITKLPIVLKGIGCKEDAVIAAEHDVEGIIVSNHGGRQLDTSRATIDVLPEVVEAVTGKTEILMDGGIRRGTDVLKAIALGAKAVLIGRPALWGLAVNGEQGAKQVLKILRKEFHLSMALCGCKSVEEITSELIM